MAQSGNGKHARRMASPALKASSDLDAMWREIDGARASLSGVVLARRPTGSITISEYMERYKLSRSTAAHQLNRMFETGVMERYIVMLPDSRAHATRTFVFLPVKSKGRK